MQQTTPSAAAPSRGRYEPCVFLRKHGIPCTLWFEDAVGHHGVPTVVFDLYILVPDIQIAAQALLEEGWKDAAPGDYKKKYHLLTEHPSLTHRCVLPNDIEAEEPFTESSVPSKNPPGPTTTILLPALDWHMTLDNLGLSLAGPFAPQLPILVDAMIDCLLDSPDDCYLRQHLVNHICYLYGYCKELKKLEFAKLLRPDNRQFHQDAISMPGLGTIPFVAYERRIRDELRSKVVHQT
ncbi:hypothetical protein HIM_01007 [Hirsutella minnesotensis 3608]|nr:hypothetical protein HIM_01007 [Hirsutella minnesotensis 3608]